MNYPMTAFCCLVSIVVLTVEKVETQTYRIPGTETEESSERFNKYVQTL